MRSKRMQPIAHLAEQKEQDAVQRYVEAQQALEQVQQQLDQLNGYKLEYQQRLHTEQSKGISIQRIREYQAFIENISSTINQSHVEIEARQKTCEHYRLAWLECRSRSQALQKVVEKYQGEERRQQERVEQKEQDEHAMRLNRRTDVE